VNFVTLGLAASAAMSSIAERRRRRGRSAGAGVELAETNVDNHTAACAAPPLACVDHKRGRGGDTPRSRVYAVGTGSMEN